MRAGLITPSMLPARNHERSDLASHGGLSQTSSVTGAFQQRAVRLAGGIGSLSDKFRLRQRRDGLVGFSCLLLRQQVSFDISLFESSSVGECQEDGEDDGDESATDLAYDHRDDHVGLEGGSKCDVVSQGKGC